MISIRRRLTFLLCLAMAGLFVVAGAGVFFVMKKILYQRFDETLAAKAGALITASEVDDGGLEIDFTVQDFAGFGKGGEDFFEIRRNNGDLLLRSPSLRGEGKAIDRFDRFTPPIGDLPVFRNDGLANGEPARFYLRKISPKDDERGQFKDIYLIAGGPIVAIQRELAILGTVLAAIGGLTILLMIPIVRYGMGKGLRPLDTLSGKISSIGSEDLTERLPTGNLPAELKPLAAGLNGWLRQLEESFERERRFSSHAAHELRTPLAEIRSIAELGKLWPEEATPERCAEIVTVTGEMETLLDKLALLARADAGRQPVEPQDCELGLMVSAVTARFDSMAKERELKIQMSVQDEIVRTDPVIWTTIFQNLYGNAISHSPIGSVITVEVGSGGISVSNPAPDLTSEELVHLFERFWRKDESRSGYGHSGLGLSVVRASSDLLGGKHSASFPEPGVLRVEVSFPKSLILEPVSHAEHAPAA